MTKREYSDEMVQSLSQAIARGEAGLSNVPGLLKVILRDSLWKQRSVAITSSVVSFSRFEQFAQAAPPEGLGCDLKTLEKLCHEDKEALEALDRAVRRSRGGDRRSSSFKDDNVHLEISTPKGHSTREALRRLAQDRPDLHARVIAGNLTPHGAMVEAGFRQRTVAIYPDDVERTAKLLQHWFGEEDLNLLVGRLTT